MVLKWYLSPNPWNLWMLPYIVKTKPTNQTKKTPKQNKRKKGQGRSMQMWLNQGSEHMADLPGLSRWALNATTSILVRERRRKSNTGGEKAVWPEANGSDAVTRCWARQGWILHLHSLEAAWLADTLISAYWYGFPTCGLHKQENTFFL